jgi:hypothetical protein
VQMALQSGAIVISMFHIAPPLAKHYFTRSTQVIATTKESCELRTGNCYPILFSPGGGSFA